MEHSAHCLQVHKVRWAYVNNALACLKLWRCSSSSSIVSYEPNDIDSPVATSIQSLLKYPCEDSLTLLARTSSSSSDFGSRPASPHSQIRIVRKWSLNGSFTGILAVSGYPRFSETCISDIVLNRFDWSCVIHDFYFICIDVEERGTQCSDILSDWTSCLNACLLCFLLLVVNLLFIQWSYTKGFLRFEWACVLQYLDESDEVLDSYKLCTI